MPAWRSRLACLSLATLALALAGLAPPGAKREPAAEVELRVVAYDELARAVRGYRGRVVVVDFWGLFCAPCKREFPHLVELHRKYHAKGVVAVSVCLPAKGPPDAETRGKVEAFLKAKGATLPGFLLTDGPEVWTRKLGIDGPPCIYIFNRDNVFVKKLVDGVDFREVEAEVKKLLAR